MVEKISDKILNFAFNNSDITVDNETEQVYRYGIQLTLSTLTGVLSVLVLGFLTNSLVKAVVFLVVIIPLRALIGGYHAKTYVKCCLLFVLSFGAVCLLETIVEKFISLQILYIVLAVCFLIVFDLAPAENKYKPIDKRKKLIIRKRAVIVFSMMSLLSLLLISVSRIVGITAVFTLCLAALMLLAEVLIKRSSPNLPKTH